MRRADLPIRARNAVALVVVLGFVCLALLPRADDAPTVAIPAPVFVDVRRGVHKELSQSVRFAVQERDLEGDHASDMSSLEALYCRMTNRMDGAPGSRLCVTPHEGGQSVDDFLLTVTVAEAEFWSSGGCDVGVLQWLADVRVPTVIVVKSNATRSFRENNLTWDRTNDVAARGAQAMYREVLGGVADLPSSGASTFRSVLRDAWVQVESGDDGDDARCAGVEWIKKKLLTGVQDVFLFESPNVGDEALSVLEVAARLASVELGRSKVDFHADEDDRSKYSLLDSILQRTKALIFVHSHAASWHSLEIAQQLRCLCVDSSAERYRTLTSPAKAYLLQCMPLNRSDDTADEMVETVLKHAPESARRSESFLQFHRRHAQRSVNISRLFADAYRFLFSSDAPPAIVRDCCASFVVTREAVMSIAHNVAAVTLSAVGSTDGERKTLELLLEMRKKLRRQPLDLAEYYSDTRVSELRVGELSMYLERFWRTAFGSTPYDTHRDLAVRDCSVPPGQAGRFQLECPPLWAVEGETNLLPEVQAAVADGRLRCDADVSRRNVFR